MLVVNNVVISKFAVPCIVAIQMSLLSTEHVLNYLSMWDLSGSVKFGLHIEIWYKLLQVVSCKRLVNFEQEA